MKILRFLNEYLEAAIISFLLIVFSILVTVQVFMRYVMQNSLSWSEELARYCMVWMVYIGVAYAAKHSLHIRVDAINMILSERAKKIVNLIAHFIFLAFCLITVYLGTGAFLRMLRFVQYTPGLRIPMAYVYIGVPLGFALTAIRLMQNIWSLIKKFRLPAPSETAG